MSRPVDEFPHAKAVKLLEAESRPLARRKALRKLWFNIHLYLGLAMGFLFVLMGLTGSCNVFMIELDELLNPDLVIWNPTGEYRSLDEILSAVKAEHPEIPGPWSLQMPRHRAGMMTATYTLPKEQTGGAYKALMVSVNPYTAEVVKSRYSGETLMSWIFQLHWTLLLGEIGHKLVGFLGLILLVSVLTGITLWWPNRNKIRQSFTIKRGASSQRLIFDLHKTFGVYSALVLIVLSFSGVYLIFSDYIRPVVNLLSPIAIDPWADLEGLASKVVPGAEPISVAAAVKAAKNIFPEAGLLSVTTAHGSTGVYTIRKRQPGEANRYWPSTAIYIDQYSGEVIATRDPNQFSAGETFLNVQFPLHSGEALGLPGRIIICVTGFVPLVLYFTGIIRWLQKRRSEKHRAARLA